MSNCTLIGSNEVVFAHGWDSRFAVSHMDFYSVPSGTSPSSTTPSFVPRYALAAGAVGNIAVFAGGVQSDGSSSGSVDVLDRSSGGYAFTTKSFTARGYLASATLANLILFAGGRTASSGTPTSIIETYSVSLGSNGDFTAASLNLSVARSQLAGVAVPAANVILFAGGYDGVSASNTIDMWNASSDLITQPTSLPTARYALCAAAAGTHVFFAGGRDSIGTVLAVVEILNVLTNTWMTAATSLSDGGRMDLACSSFSYNNVNYVLFAGGLTPLSTYSQAIDIYDESGAYITGAPSTTLQATTTAQVTSTTPIATTNTPSPTTTSPSTTSSSPQSITTTTSSPSTPPSSSTVSPSVPPTTTPPAPTVAGGCEPPKPFPSSFCINSTWIVNQTIVLNTTISISTPTPINITGNVTITSGVAVSIAAINISSSSPIITSSGCVQIDPNTSLVLDLGKASPINGKNITVIEASLTCGGILGNFSSVQTIGGTLLLCQSLSSSQITSTTQLAVLLSVSQQSSGSCRKKKSQNVTIITGCALGGAILLILLALGLYYAAYVRRWIRCCDCIFVSREDDSRSRTGSRTVLFAKRLEEIDTN